MFLTPDYFSSQREPRQRRKSRTNIMVHLRQGHLPPAGHLRHRERYHDEDDFLTHLTDSEHPRIWWIDNRFSPISRTILHLNFISKKMVTIRSKFLFSREANRVIIIFITCLIYIIIKASCKREFLVGNCDIAMVWRTYVAIDDLTIIISSGNFYRFLKLSTLYYS